MQTNHPLHDLLFPMVDTAIAERSAASLAALCESLRADERALLDACVAAGVPDATMAPYRGPTSVVSQMREAEMVEQTWLGFYDHEANRRTVAALVLTALRRDGRRLLRRLASSGLLHQSIRTWAYKILARGKDRKGIAYATLVLHDQLRWELDQLEPEGTGEFEGALSAQDLKLYRGVRLGLVEPEDYLRFYNYSDADGHASDELRHQDLAIGNAPGQGLDPRGAHRPAPAAKRTRKVKGQWTAAESLADRIEALRVAVAAGEADPAALAELEAVLAEARAASRQVTATVTVATKVRTSNLEGGPTILVRRTFQRVGKRWTLATITVGDRAPVHVHESVPTAFGPVLDRRALTTR